jgi:hypothetical protein
MLSWLEVIRGNKEKGRRTSRLKGNQEEGDEVERQLGRPVGGMYPYEPLIS